RERPGASESRSPKLTAVSNPSPEPSGLPLRALAMVLLSAAIVFAGLGFISMSGSDTDASAAGTSSSGAPQEGSGGSDSTARAADATSRTEDRQARATTPASTQLATSGTSAPATTTPGSPDRG